MPVSFLKVNQNRVTTIKKYSKMGLYRIGGLMKGLRFIALLLMVIGALNWGLIGFFQYDLVAKLFGGMSATGARFIYGLIGLAGLCGLCGLLCRCCSSHSCKCGPHCNCDCCRKK